MKSMFLVLFLSFLASIYGLVTFSVQGKVNLPEPTIERLREITVSLENTGKIEYLNKRGQKIGRKKVISRFSRWQYKSL